MRPKTFGLGLRGTLQSNGRWSRLPQQIRRGSSATDPKGFEASFQAWLAVAEAGLKTLRAAGIVGKPYLINAEELLAWCLMRNRPNNSSSRSEFVAERLQAENESSNIG